MADFLMPSLGADMDFGTLIEWRVRPGDAVRRGDVVAVVETDKAAVEIEVFETGTVDALLVEPGTRVPVGTPLARIRAESSSATVGVESRPPAARAPSEPRAPQPNTPPPRQAAPSAAPAPTPLPGPTRRRISPLARQTARRLGVDIEAVRGSGPAGAVTEADVERAVAAVAAVAGGPAPAAAVGAPEHDRAQGMRRAIAAAVSRANREIPHYYLEETVDFHAAARWLAEENSTRPARERLLPAALFVRAVALAARAVPQLNGAWRDDRFEAASSVHVGMAISLRDGGLVAPAILDADRKSVVEVMQDLVQLARGARRGMLRGSQMTSSTITVTSLGDMGVDRVFGVIYPPQVALVGFGRVVERPWAAEGMVGVRPTVSVTLAADHRASDGYTGARFLTVIRRALQQPERL